MKEIFFTSDLHFGHDNIIRFCNRPFSNADEMDEALINNWNTRVTNNDTVFVIGDLIFRAKKAPEEYLSRLKGKKYLLLGNHDKNWIKKCDLLKWFVEVNDILNTSDGKRKITLCHFPMFSWMHEPHSYMIYGHIHNNTFAPYWKNIWQNDRMLNACTDINGYQPVTFDELVINNRAFKADNPYKFPSPFENRKRRIQIISITDSWGNDFNPTDERANLSGFTGDVYELCLGERITFFFPDSYSVSAHSSPVIEYGFDAEKQIYNIKTYSEKIVIKEIWNNGVSDSEEH